MKMNSSTLFHSLPLPLSRSRVCSEEVTKRLHICTIKNRAKGLVFSFLNLLRPEEDLIIRSKAGLVPSTPSNNTLFIKTDNSISRIMTT
uniref:Uncharacterized protein n=1 Tax=Brassica oleracea TaxID=3712 RepID=A0A3P6EQD4_BRAOL|nr:unnamed protein product [Brassica oleracea]